MIEQYANAMTYSFRDKNKLIIAFLVCFILFYFLFPLPDSIWLVIVFGCCVFLIANVDYPYFLLILVFTASFFNTSLTSSQLFGLNIQPYQFINLFAFIALWIGVLKKNTKMMHDFRLLGLVLMFLFLMSFSCINSPDPSKSFIQSLQLWLSFCAFLMVYYSVVSKELFRFTYDVILILGVMEGLLGVSAWSYTILTGNLLSPIVSQQNMYGFIPNGTWPETNIYGDLLIPTVMLLYSSFGYSKKKSLLFLLIGICIFGIVISQTRGAWISLILTSVLFYLGKLRLRRKKSKNNNMIFLLLLISAMVVFLYWGLNYFGVSDTLRSRIETFGNLSDPQSTFTFRIGIFYLAFSDFWRSFWVLGSGVGSFALRHQIFGGPHDWISNVYIAILFEGGIIALLLFLGFIKRIVARALRIIKTIQLSNSNMHRLYGLVFAVISMLFTGMSNNYSWMSITWIYFGLLAVGGKLLMDEIPYK